MDTELARTFLTITAAGSFMAAAARLHVTQSTISARIRTLEDQLRCRLFVRNKSGATLTPAGRVFQKHAALLLRTVEHARRDVGIPAGFSAALTVGARLGLWEGLLIDWLPLLRKAVPDLSLRAEIGFEADLMQGLIDGRIDVAVMYTPQSRPGLTVEPLFVEHLRLVTTGGLRGEAPGPRYVLVDWGPEFHAKHRAAFPSFAGPAITANTGWLGMQYILRNGGSGYFPERIARPLLEEGRLRYMRGAPVFSLPAYVAYRTEGDTHVIARAVASLKHGAGRIGGLRRAARN